jgi:sortase A
MKQWLDYATGAGQAQLPSGMVHLPETLLTEAKAAVAKVGTSPVTGPCASALATGGPGAAGGGGVASAPTGAAAAPPLGAARNAAPIGAATTGASASSASSTPTREDKPSIAAVPAFAGSSVLQPLDGAIGLLGIVVVTSLAVFITARALSGKGGVRGQGGTVFLVLLWGAVAVAGIALVIYQVGPMIQQRQQDSLLKEYKGKVRQAAFASEGLQRPASKTDEKPPDPGSPVGVMEIGALKVQAVVVEGMTPSETAKGPGHVPGTAGLGQPSNAVVVARRNSYGAPFKELESLQQGDRILVTTTQGQSVYKVSSTAVRPLNDKVYDTSEDDRLTLVTSASRAPWNDAEAFVVVAKMQGLPFAPTAQGARTDNQISLRDTGDVWPVVVLVMLGYGLVIGLSVLLYRSLQFRVAYLLSLAPIVALTVITGETLSRVVPSWT